MTRMGADGYSSKDTTQLSAKVDDTLKRDFRDACDHLDVTMTDVIEGMMAEFVDEHGPAHVSDSGEYYPDNDHERRLYEVCLGVAEHTSEGPKIYQRRHASTIAQKTQQVSKSELSDALMPLRRDGYIALGPMPPDLQGQHAQRWRHWYVKPLCADPDQWKFRESQR